MNKIITALGLVMMMTMVSVSAYSIENVEQTYDKRTNMITISYDLILDDECRLSTGVEVYDHKGNFVGTSEPVPRTFCHIDFGSTTWDAPHYTGIFHEEKVITLDDKKNIKGLGNLMFAIKYGWNVVGEYPVK